MLSSLARLATHPKWIFVTDALSPAVEATVARDLFPSHAPEACTMKAASQQESTDFNVNTTC